MARSIKEIGEKVESEVRKELVKRESDILKDIMKSIPSDARVRVIKIEADGTRKYCGTVSINDFDSTEPFAWLKRRFATKYGSGEYYMEFISSDGNIVNSTQPVYIETDEEKKDEDITQKFLSHINEALKIKEEAIHKKAEAIEELAKVEKAQAQSLIDIVSKQMDMMTKMYEERIKLLKEEFEKVDDKDKIFLLQEINRLRDDFKEAIDNIINTLRSVQEDRSDDQSKIYEVLLTILSKTLEKNSLDDTLKVIQIMKDTYQKEKSFIEQILEDPAKYKLFKDLFGIDERTNSLQEIISIIEKKMENQKDFFTEILENPQKFELLKKLFGFEDIKSLKEEMKSILNIVIERSSPREEKKDMIDEITSSFSKIQKLKDILAPALGIQPQPAKSILELISNIINSPVMPEIVSRIMDGLTKAKLIEHGYIPQDYAGSIVPINQMKKQQPAQKVIKNEVKKEDNMLKQFILEAIIESAGQTSANDTEEDFAKRIANILYEKGKTNPAVITSVALMNKKQRKSYALSVLKEAIPDLPDNMAKKIVDIAEKEIQKKILEDLKK